MPPLTHLSPSREPQLRTLSSLLPSSSSPPPTPRTIILHGPPATGKTALLRALLHARAPRPHVFVSAAECVSARQLLERALRGVQVAVAAGGEAAVAAAGPRCENLSAFVAGLQGFLEEGEDGEGLVLALDGVDEVRDAPPTWLAALARLGEFVPRLTTVLVLRRHPASAALPLHGLPFVYFPPYSRAQSLQIVSQSPRAIFSEAASAQRKEQDGDETHDDDDDSAWLWSRFCAAVWDSLGHAAAHDLRSFSQACHRLWPAFVRPVVAGDLGTRDFSRLLVRQRWLLQDDAVLVDSLVASPVLANDAAAVVDRNPASRPLALPYLAKWLLLAAYLASYNPPATDAALFMKTTEPRRRRRRRGGGSGGTTRGQRSVVARRLLGTAPAAFPLDRLLAILHAIVPHDVRADADVYAQLAGLAGLRLVVRSGGGAGDVLEAGARWRVGTAVGWEVVRGLAREVGFEVAAFCAE